MISALRLVISENGKLIDTITKKTGTQPTQLIETLEEFRQSANAALSKLIENSGLDADDYSDNTEENNDDDEDDDEQLVSPSKRKR